MRQTNFLLASSAVIPLLALTLLVELRAYQRPRGLSPSRGTAVTSLVAIVGTALMVATSEWIDLRGLELGRINHHDLRLIWIAMLLLGVEIVIFLILDLFDMSGRG